MASINWLLRGAVVAALGISSIGCSGGVGPGDYVFYRVALADPDEGSSCLGATSPNVENDSTTYMASGTFILYAGLEEAYYLDMGERTLEGTLADDTYSFSGKLVDIEYPSDDMKITTTETTTLTLTVDGAAATGTAVTKISVKCSGSTGCPDSSSCTVTQDFVGTEVEDVELDHNID